MDIQTCGPNEAIIVSGVCHGNRPKIVAGGRVIVIPCLQTIQRLPLNTSTLIVHSPKVYTVQGVPISVTGVAQVISLRKSLIFYPRSRMMRRDEKYTKNIWACGCQWHATRNGFSELASGIPGLVCLAAVVGHLSRFDNAPADSRFPTLCTRASLVRWACEAPFLCPTQRAGPIRWWP